jgi:hypothetical protein
LEADGASADDEDVGFEGGHGGLVRFKIASDMVGVEFGLLEMSQCDLKMSAQQDKQLWCNARHALIFMYDQSEADQLGHLMSSEQAGASSRQHRRPELLAPESSSSVGTADYQQVV